MNEQSIAVALDLMSVELRYNTRSGRRQYRTGGEWVNAQDSGEFMLLSDMEKWFTLGKDSNPFKVSKADWERYSGAIEYRNHVDPLIGWIDALPEWDLVPRLDNLLYELFDVNDGNMRYTGPYQWASRYSILGQIKRTMEPGAKLDVVPILISPQQGCGKSTFISKLPPQEIDGLFKDGVNWKDNEKMIESVSGASIVELGELSNIGRHNMETVKQFITRTFDTYRTPWNRHTDDRKRRFTIWGTSNKMQGLPLDYTGHRRWLPIHVGKGGKGYRYITEYMDANRLQLWAEAWHFYKMELQVHFPDEFAELQNELTSNAQQSDDTMENAIDVMLEGYEFLHDRERKYDLIQISNIRQSNSIAAHVSDDDIRDYMLRNGWHRGRKRADGDKNTRLYMYRLCHAQTQQQAIEVDDGVMSEFNLR